MTKINYPSINGLRAISVVLVIVSHLEIKYGIFNHFSNSIFTRLWINFLHDGNLGVNVFFVVSGFLITTILLEEERQNKKISLKHFFIKRSLRIFPAYYFLLLVYFFFDTYNLIGIAHNSWVTALSFTKYINWFSDLFTSHLWSLSVEEHFYILFPFIFLGGDTFRKRCMIILFISSPFVRMTYHLTQIIWLNDLTFFTRIDAISMGCICAFYKDWILTKLSRNWTFWIWFSILGLLGLRFSYLLAYELKYEVVFIPFGVTAGSFANIFISIILFYSVFGPQNSWHRFLNLKFVSYIGVLSYSIYLWQQIVIFGNFSWFSTIPEKILLIFVLALCSYYFIEKPFLKLKSKFENKRSIKHSTSNIQH